MCGQQVEQQRTYPCLVEDRSDVAIARAVTAAAVAMGEQHDPEWSLGDRQVAFEFDGSAATVLSSSRSRGSSFVAAFEAVAAATRAQSEVVDDVVVRRLREVLEAWPTAAEHRRASRSDQFVCVTSAS